MNLIILFEEDFTSEHRVVLSDHRLQHVRSVHRAKIGDTLRVGLLNGKMGEGLIEELNESRLSLHIKLDTAPPPPLPLTLIVALPRPKMIRRILRTTAEMGIKSLYFINSFKVEKSYWQSPALEADTVHGYLIQGLEQACDTTVPEIHFRKRFKPFVEDELAGIIKGSEALIAHPGLGAYCPQPLNKIATLAIGPEGGFIPYEVEKLQSIGFKGIHLGKRILRVENAITTLTAKIYSS